MAHARYRGMGDELRKRREEAGLSGAELGRHVGWSKSKVSRVETGKLELSTVDVVYYLGACEIWRGQALDLLAEFRDAEIYRGYWYRPHGQWREDSLCSLIYHESTARASTSYEPHILPGLLQTEDYARAVIRRYGTRTEESVEFCVRARLERQQVLHRPRPGSFTFLVHEHALRPVVDDPAIMHEQLLALMLVDGLPHVSIRLVPASEDFGGAFRLFEFARHNPLVYLSGQIAGLFLEDPDFVDPYRALIPGIADAALDEGQSREFVAALADVYDRGSARDHVEEEQL